MHGLCLISRFECQIVTGWCDEQCKGHKCAAARDAGAGLTRTVTLRWVLLVLGAAYTSPIFVLLLLLLLLVLVSNLRSSRHSYNQQYPVFHLNSFRSW
jgi:hypothetical protein